MERALGIGGVFFRAKDAEALNLWYAEQLGVAGIEIWHQEQGPTVWSAFGEDTTYFGRAEQQTMVNFRVRDLDAMLSQLRAAGASVDDKTESDEQGRFGWASDPEGNRFELWEPSATA